MFHSPSVSKSRNRTALRRCVHSMWFGLFVIAAVFTIFFSAWQGFSPDGPPPGFKPEPLALFFIKHFPLMLVGIAVHLWWFFMPLLILTIWDFQRSRATRRKRVTDYDL